MFWMILLALVGIVVAWKAVPRRTQSPPPPSVANRHADVLAAPPSPPAPARFMGVPPPDYEIEYADAFGEITERQVRLLAVAEEPASRLLYVRAYCFIRNAERTFRVDRMLSVRLMPQGKHIVDPDGHFRMTAATRGGLQIYGGKTLQQIEDEAAHARAMVRARAGLKGLIWLAAADGEISEPEMSVMFQWIDARAKAARDGHSAWSRDEARRYIRESRPTLADVRGGLGRMGKAEAAAFIAHMDALMAADGIVTDRERGRAAQMTALLPTYPSLQTANRPAPPT